MEPICEIRLPAHHPAVKMAKGGMVRIKAKPVPEEKKLSPLEDMPMGRGPQVQPLEQRYHVMGIESEDGADPKEEAAETAAQERAEREEKPATRKKAKTPAELIRQKRAGK